MRPYLIGDILRFFHITVRAACVRNPAQSANAATAYDAAVQKQIAEDSLAFLQAHIDDSASFGQIMDVFAELCAQPTAGEELLFEAGTYAFTGEPLFTVSLARQIPNGEDEFFQIRAEWSFRPDADNAGIEDVIWIDPTDADAFSAVRQSAAFAYADSHTAQSVDVRIDET